MFTDAELLRHYIERRDEQAFAELVRRHLGLVYASALRRTGGRAHLAEEVAQTVFTGLARKARALVGHPTLTGWFYRSTRYAAIDAARAEQRRQDFAQSLHVMPDLSSLAEPSPEWEQLRPVIDEAMDRLNERDREIMLLRYFNDLTFVEVGARLNLSENAARMRSERALDKLRGHLSRQGVSSTAAALSLLLTQAPIVAAPAGLATSVTAGAISASAGGSVGIAYLFLMSKFTLPAISAVLAAGLTALVWTSAVRSVGAEELANLRQENALLAQATAVGASEASVAAATSELNARASSRVHAIVQAVDKKFSAHVIVAAVKSPAVRSTAQANGYRNRGQATPLDAHLTFAWADDAADVEAVARLITFAPDVREQALAVLARMPESLRTQYPTPEKLYAFFFVADALVSPPPAADVVERFESSEVRPGLVAVHPPGVTKNPYLYQQTQDGWKWVVPPAGVRYAPNVLNNETILKLKAPAP